MKNISTVRKFGVGIASLAMVASMAAPAFATTSVINLPNGGQVDMAKQRIAGADRIETSLKVAESVFKGHEESVKTIYFVGYDAVVDAATSGMLSDGPVIGMPMDAASQKLLGYTIKSVFKNAEKFVAVGGPKVISDDSLKAVMSTAGVTSSSRLGGKDRYETNVAVAKAAFKTPGTRLYLTRGDNVVDALTAGTLKSGPVLLVNPTGNINKATADYVNSTGTFKLNNTVVIGGKSALSDEQALKLFPENKDKGADVTAWNSEALKKAQMEAVQMAAAKFYGQSAWQHMTADKLTSDGSSTNLTADDVKGDYKDIDPAHWGVFGLGASTVETPTDLDASDVDINKATTEAGKTFVGYLPTMTALDAAKGKVDDPTKLPTQLVDIQTKWVALEGDTANKASDVITKAGSSKAKDLYDALVTVYGKAGIDSVWPTQTSTGNKVDKSGLFTFSGKDDDTTANRTVTGMKQSVLDTLVATAKSSKTNLTAQVDGSAAFGKPLSDLAKGDATTLEEAFALDKDTNLDVNKVALRDLFNDRYDAFKMQFDAAKKDLIDQIRTYFNLGAAPNGSFDTSTSTRGMVRLAGKNRYETSAYVSIFRQSATSAGGVTMGDDQVNPTQQFLACGEDAHLIDAVYAGQVTTGSVVLVPSKGDIDPLVLTDLQHSYKVNKIKPVSLFAIGGSASISDDVFKAALAGMVK